MSFPNRLKLLWSKNALNCSGFHSLRLLLRFWTVALGMPAGATRLCTQKHGVGSIAFQFLLVFPPQKNGFDSVIVLLI